MFPIFTVFIADDDKFSVEATYSMFNWSELNIEKIEKIYSAHNLTKRIIQESPDVVFIDIELGDISGLDIIKECKNNAVKSHFIIISGHDNFSYAHAAVNLGALHYLLKPIDFEDVAVVSAKLKNLLTNNQSSANEELDIPFDAWKRIQIYIENNYAKKITAQEICRNTLTNQTRFFQLFKINTGKTFIEYLTEFRLEKAKTMLMTSSKKIEDIAFEIGIPNVYYFIQIFKNRFGVSPKSYRIQAQRGED